MKLAVVYWSGTGNTESMADIIREQSKALGADITTFIASEFDASDVKNFDAIAFGCPASGDEELEPDEFQPMWENVKPHLTGKKIALFGSYSWADGEWMRIWEQDARSAGAILVYDPIIAEERPDAVCAEELKRMAEAVLK